MLSFKYNNDEIKKLESDESILKISIVSLKLKRSGALITTVPLTKKTIFLKLKIEEDQTINVPYGNYICTKVLPIRADSKKFKNRAELDIMFSNDIKKYPVMIRLKLKYGYLKLELDRVVNWKAWLYLA